MWVKPLIKWYIRRYRWEALGRVLGCIPTLPILLFWDLKDS